MERLLYKDLLKWKNSKNRKPLILEGARQVGKTWLLCEFGRREYESLVYINCDLEPFAGTLFEDVNPERILLLLEAYKGVKPLPGRTLIVFDGIQETPRGLAALKYFCEKAPEYHVAVAGSLLGITLHPGTSFPVGKVCELTLRPLCFTEFLWAIGRKGLADLLDGQDLSLTNGIHGELSKELFKFFYTGGMPEAVMKFAEGRPLAEIREIQSRIIAQYEADFSKHVQKAEAVRIHQVFNSIPGQLCRENSKFIYGALKQGGRAREFEVAIQWLADAGIVNRLNRVTKPASPLKFYEDCSAFKLFPLDCGLLGAMVNSRADEVLAGNAGFQEYKGGFAETYVFQEIKAVCPWQSFYFSAQDSRQEVDFLWQAGSNIIPVEVKSGDNLRSKSLSNFVAKYECPQSWRFSLAPYRQQERLVNVPLYAAGAFLRRQLANDAEFSDAGMLHSL